MSTVDSMDLNSLGINQGRLVAGSCQHTNLFVTKILLVQQALLMSHHTKLALVSFQGHFHLLHHFSTPRQLLSTPKAIGNPKSNWRGHSLSLAPAFGIPCLCLSIQQRCYILKTSFRNIYCNWFTLTVSFSTFFSLCSFMFLAIFTVCVCVIA